MRIRFLGAARTVTGSMHLLETSSGALLVDCGLFQGRRSEANQRNRNLPRATLGADAMILTHAHIDHSGNIPTLVKSGFKGKIYATSPTVDLAHSLLLDSAHIQESDAEYLNRKFGRDPDFVPIVPLYTRDDAERALERFVPLPYDEEFEPIPGVRARLIEAGHILGSAQAVLQVKKNGTTERLLFTGDLGRKGLPVIKDPALPREQPRYVVIESTYGNRLHRDIASSQDELADLINETVKKGGKVLVPAFAVGRTQELVYALNQLSHEKRIPKLPIFVDSPLSTAVTKVFEKHIECFDAEASAFLRENGNPFGFKNLTYVSSRDESMKLNDLKEPAIIIASSGMCEAGRILHHLRNNVGDERNTVIIVGFQAEHTLGRRLVERRPKVRIFGLEHEVHARVATIGAFSAHADRNDLVAHARALGPVARFFIVHGETEGTEGLKAALEEIGREGYIPTQGEAVELD
jgi:metallo-beta-lactamase family protein